MFISLVRMPVDGLRFEHKYQDRELDLGGFEFRFIDTPSVAGRIDRAGSEMRVRGEIHARLCARCDRCLGDVEFATGIPFDLIYAPEDPGAGRSGEIELHSRDMDFALYDNDRIDLDSLVLEQLELSLPRRILCSENCKGLCPQCGADLNSGDCGCRRPVDPRWQALADLKNGGHDNGA